MTLAEGVARLERFGEIARLLWKYGRSDLVEQAGIAPELREREPALGGETAAGAEQLADDLEAMGPTFVKLGQILSTRADLLPPPYLKGLARLRTRSSRSRSRSSSRRSRRSWESGSARHS